MSAPLEELVQELHEDISAGLYTGAQLVVALGGETVCDEAVGTCLPGHAMRPETVHNVYCGVKPIVAMTLANTLTKHGLDETLRIGDALGVDAGAMTVADVLAHRCGLHKPLGYEYFFMTREQRAAATVASVLVASRTAQDPAYSEIAGWSLLCDVIEGLTGRPAIEQIEADLRALGIDDLWFRASGYDDPKVAAIGCYTDLTNPDVALPLLHDRVDYFFEPDRAGPIGGYASMRALATWYGRLLDVYNGGTHAGLPSTDVVRSWTATQRPPADDLVFRRECAFGYGFMTDLSGHFFGTAPSAASFGHAGFLGNSYAFGDPECGLVAALFTNGIGSDPSVGVEFNRRRRVAAIYRLLGLTAGVR